jgi:hypothetical protein
MPAESQAQQKFMGMVHAVQEGDMKAPSKEVADAAKSIKKEDAKDFAETKRKGLPEHKKEKKAMIDMTKLSALDLSYIEGFIKACADKNADPEVLLAKWAGEEQPAEDGKKKEEGGPKKAVKRVAGGVGRGALAGGAIGAGLGGVAGAVGAARLMRSAPPAASKGKALAAAIKMILGGAVGGGAAGAVSGGMTGGVVRAVTP